MRVTMYRAAESPRAWGLAHGEEWRKDIREIAEIRLQLTLARPQWSTREELMDVARAHIPTLLAYDDALAAELQGIADGAGVSLEQIIIHNHYTDLRDINPKHPWGPGEGPQSEGDEGCTVVTGPTPEGRVLGMTWDTHSTASDYLLLVGVPRHEHQGRRVPASWSFSMVGCVGMTGFNEDGLGVVINNLISTDAKVGLVWPALIRRILRESTVADAKRLLKAAPLGSGHHYVVGDPSSAYGVETSGERYEEVLTDPERQYHHTNHCLVPSIEEVSKVADGSTTFKRFTSMGESLAEAPLASLADLWDRYRYVVEPLHEDPPHKVGTCGILAMDLDQRVGRSVQGGAVDRRFMDLSFEHGEPVVR